MILTLLTPDPNPDEVLPALLLLAHSVRPFPAHVSSLLEVGAADVALVDARTDLVAARGLCHLIRASVGGQVPVVTVFTEGAMIAATADWALDDFLLSTSRPAEIDARLRLVVGRHAVSNEGEQTGQIILGELVVDEGTYTAHLRGKPLALTYKEFELLKFLTENAGRVFTRAQLLQQVWGYDFFGGTRTVDVHIRRLRAKLGAEHEGMIGTVRNVGYHAMPPTATRPRSAN